MSYFQEIRKSLKQIAEDMACIFSSQSSTEVPPKLPQEQKVLTVEEAFQQDCQNLQKDFENAKKKLGL